MNRIPVFWVSCGTMTTAPTAPGFQGSGNIFLTTSRNSTSALFSNDTTTPDVFTQLPNLPGDTATCIDPSCATEQSVRKSKRDAKLNPGCQNNKAHTTTNYCNTTVSPSNVIVDLSFRLTLTLAIPCSRPATTHIAYFRPDWL